MARPKRNNAEYFSHDADMRNDIKIKALRRKFSHIGYAVWNYILEILTDTDFFEIEWNEIQIELLSGDFDVDPIKLNEIVNYCLMLGLLQLKEGKISSKKHKDRFSGLLSKRERDVKRVFDNENKRKLNETELSPAKTPKVKYSKVKKSKVKDISDDISKEDAPTVASSLPLSPFVPEEKIDLDLLKEKCLTSPIWFENAQRSLKKTGGEIFTLINSFVSELKAGGRGGEKTEQDFKTHFINWAKLQKNGTNKQQTYEERNAELASRIATGESLLCQISTLDVPI